MSFRLPKPDPKTVNLALRIVVFVFLAVAASFVVGSVLAFLLAPRLFPAAVLTTLIAAVAANALAMRIWEQHSILDIGLQANLASLRNGLAGLAAGVLAGLVVTLGPILEGAAHLVKTGPSLGFGAIVFTVVLLLCGALGEEMLFRGYAFQILMNALGPFATILPISVLFAAVHLGNPNLSTLALVNTGLWGVALGYAFWKSGDLWFPTGLHFGWNATLPLLGARLSGLFGGESIIGYRMDWSAGALWSGGEYGPEGGLATTLAVVLLFVWLIWKAPVKRQTPYLVRDRWDD